jgi:hypothetical protein
MHDSDAGSFTTLSNRSEPVAPSGGSNHEILLRGDHRIDEVVDRVRFREVDDTIDLTQFRGLDPIPAIERCDDVMASLDGEPGDGRAHAAAAVEREPHAAAPARSKRER